MEIISTKRTLVICPKCDGLERFREIDGSSQYSIINEYKCKTCQGSGKVWQQTQISIEPFKHNKNTFKTH